MTFPEEWKSIPGYEGWYEASSLGRIRNIKERPGTKVGRVLAPQRHPAGYLQVRLHKGSGGETRTIHSLIALAFLGQPSDTRLEVCHADADKHNNAVENLRWDTRSENALDRVRAGSYVNQNTKLTQCLNGHPFDAENTYQWGASRICRQCKRDRRAKARSEGRKVT